MVRGFSVAWAIAALSAATPAVAAAPQCHLLKYLDLPVQLIGRRAIVTTKFGDKEARFILDSGAFYSTMSRASAAQYGLTLTQAPANLRLRGINGETSVDVATVKKFVLGGVTLPETQFLVGGTDTGSVGLLGQNFLSMFDVEYDFPHGMIRLLRAKDCAGVTAAYWAGDRPVTALSLMPRVPPFKVATVATVTLNGTKLHAVFDTGAPGSSLTLAAAKRAGITPQSPGVTADGFSTGLGSRSLRAWTATFDMLNIGGEAIPKPRLRFADMEIGAGDMLIGFDFFLTHRILVENSVDRMLVTYEGGPVFGLTPARAVDASGAVIDLNKTGEAPPTDADGFARRGAVLASGGKIEAAIADFDQAVTLAPGDAHILRLRAQARLANRQPLLANADLDKAIAIDPADGETRLIRAGVKLAARDPAGAIEDLRAADRSLPPSADLRLRLAGMFNGADDHEAALPNYEQWLKFHAGDANRPAALNGRCYTRALLNRELDKALDDCNAAIRARPTVAIYLDSRALVRLRRGELPLAKMDYDAALAMNPRMPMALYLRGIVRRKLGDAAGADADRTAALVAQPGLPARLKALGLEE